MSKELVISADRHETKVAILEDDQLVEVFFQRGNEYSLAGSIHKGRVTRVLPGMQSAFVDLGLDRDTFLYVSDFFEEVEDVDQVSDGRRDEPRRERESRPPAPPREARSDTPRGDVSRGDVSRVEEASGATGESADASAPVEGSAPSPSAGGRRPDDDGRDRRGRSRRRRNRGRGFPESKYASTESRYSAPEASRGPRPVEAAPAAELREERPAPSAGAADSFSVLPGESLAKYTRSNIAPLDEAEEEEIRHLQDAAGELESQATAEAAPTAEPPLVVSEPENEIQEQAGQPEIPALEEAVTGPEAELEAVSVEEVEEEEAPAAEENENEPVDAAEDDIQDEADAAQEAAEAADAADAAQEAAEAAIEGGALESGEGGEIVESAESAPSSETPAPQLTAQVREQGGRYGHRMPRRMRRKMRGGGGGPDTKFDPERKSENSPAAASETRVSRPEPTRGGGRPDRAPTPSISELLKEGQEIIVQIAKEPLGQKGARITSHIALPGRYVVYMPTVEHTGVSRKIASDEERQRLKRILQVHHHGAPGGFIVRTAGEGKSEEDIASDMNFLANLWMDIRQKAEKRPAPLLLHHDLDIVQRTLRDQFTEEFKDVWVDNEELYERILGFVQRFHPSLVPRVKLYTRPEPIFDAFNITAELEKALRPKVWLKSGGYIVINQTEALVAIDVNTGKYVGRSNRLEDTIVKTNTEAVKEIVRQIRLRDLGGIIVVDFIDMDERKNRQKVMQVLEDAMRADRAPYKILQFNDFGLVAITRKRVKQSLERSLCMPCPHCEGAGYVKSVQTIVGEILQEAHKIASAVEGKDVLLRVHPDVAKLLKSNQNKYLEEIEEIMRRPVLVRADPLLHHEKFDLT